MARIFVNYRRALSKHSAALVADFLRKRFGARYVFIDVKGIEGGEPFEARIEKEIAQAEALIVVIEKDRATHSDNDGVRLAREDDFVRREIALALARNSASPPNQGPVKIIPLLVDDTPMPRAAELPAALQELAALNSVRFQSESDLRSLADLIEQHLGESPLGQYGTRILRNFPDLSARGNFRYRLAKSRSDLRPFVEFSDAETVIAGANAGLEAQSRTRLYEAWCAASAARPDLEWDHPDNRVSSFMILDRQTVNGWEPIGVSIVLPLTEQMLKVNAATLEEPETARGSSRCLLLDTWIIARDPYVAATARGVSPRINTGLFGNSLILRHLAELWDPDSSEPMLFLCEPANPQIARVLSSLGFLKRDRNQISGDLYLLSWRNIVYYIIYDVANHYLSPRRY